jgi:hypothetical protein
MVDQGRWQTDKQCIMVEGEGVSMELLRLGWTKLVAAVAH